jgi:hypothetical protein
MTHSRRTSFDCQLVEAYLVRLQSDIEAKWREIRWIRDELGVLMRSRTVRGQPDGETVRTVTERLDRMLATSPGDSESPTLQRTADERVPWVAKDSLRFAVVGRGGVHATSRRWMAGALSETKTAT